MTTRLVKLRKDHAVVALAVLFSAFLVTAQTRPVDNAGVAWVLVVDDLHVDFRNTRADQRPNNDSFERPRA